MTTFVEEAIEALKEMLDNQQQTVGHAILDYAHEDGYYHLTRRRAGTIAQESVAATSHSTKKSPTALV